MDPVAAPSEAEPQLGVPSSAAEPLPSGRADRVANWIGRWRGALGFVVFFFAFFLFNLNHTNGNMGDTRSIVDLSWWIAQGHPPVLNGHPNYAGNEEWFGYWAKRLKSGKIAIIPAPGTAIFAAPGFAFLKACGMQDDKMASPAQAKIFASLAMALVLLMIWRVLGELHDWLTATVLTMLLTVASPFWPVYSQTLWSQTGAFLAQATSVFLLLWPMRKGFAERHPYAMHVLLLVAGFMAGWTFFARPTFVIWPMGYLVFLLLRFRKQSWSGVLGLIIALACGMWFMQAATDTFFGMHAEKAMAEGRPTLSIGQMSKNLFASLIAPFRGLFFFSPWTLLATIYAAILFRRRANWTPWFGLHFLFALSVFGYLSVFGLLGAWEAGPRHAGDILLSLTFLCAPIFAKTLHKWWGLPLILILAAPSVYVYSRSSKTSTFPSVCGI
jgi:hypothetical protein